MQALSATTVPERDAAAAKPLAIGWRSVVLVCLAVWLLMRLVFFVGIVGSDDMYHMRFAALWDRTPVNHWEVRLLANALIGASMRLFGRGEAAAALPSALASLTVLGCVLWWCRRHGTLGQAWWAGPLVAVLPIDVEAAGSISAYPLMTALLAVGTIGFLEAPRSRRARWIAAGALSLGVVTHLSAVYYAAALTLTALAVDRRRFGPVVACTLLMGVTAMVADMAVFHVTYGDALLRFRVSMGQAPTENPVAPMFVDGRFNASFATWPLTQLLYSKAFGVALSAAAACAVLRRRDLPPPLRLLAVAGAVYWIWMCFGSQIPWEYRPFWRLTRFWQPLVPAAVLILGWVLAQMTMRRRLLLGGGIVAVCVLNLLAGGSWDQSAHVSRELLTYARSHPRQRFVTDYHTLNEMYVLGGVSSVANVATTADVHPSRLLDRQALRIEPSEVSRVDALLDNPLNTARTPTFAALLREHAGRVVFETEIGHRVICRLVPPLRSRSWSVRKPPARVLACTQATVIATGKGAKK